MKKTIGVVLSAILIAGVSLAAEKPEIKDDQDKTNYSVGYQIGKDFKTLGLPLNPELIVKGAQDALSGSEALMDGKDIQSTLIEFRKKSFGASRRQLTNDLAAGSNFLEKNAKEEGVVLLPSGMQYKVLQQGNGKTPAANDEVTVHFRGTTIDGTEFDNSYRKGKPASVRVDRAIPGWKEALQMMKEGDKWRIFLPPNLAYGNRKPLDGKTVVFDLELLLVNASKERRETK